MKGVLYQFLHPWHWLTYGQNATVLAAMAALAGLIGLFFYTRYTRRMMDSQESTARASITPVLVSQDGVEFVSSKVEWGPGSDKLIGRGPRTIAEYKSVLKIRNIGAGAALFLRAWHQSVSDQFVDDPLMLLKRTPGAKDGVTERTELMRGEHTTVTFEGFEPDDIRRRWVFVVETIDQTDEKHQLKLVRTPVGDNEAEITVSMVHREQRKRGGDKS